MTEIDYNEDQTLPAFDGKRVHYVARNCSDPSKPLVLHVHGLPDSPRGLLSATSGEFFADHGYAHASLYLNIDYDPTARSLADLTFTPRSAIWGFWRTISRRDDLLFS